MNRYVLREHGGFHIDPLNRAGQNNRPVRELLVLDSMYGYEVVWRTGPLFNRRHIPARRVEAQAMCDDLNAWAALQ